MDTLAICGIVIFGGLLLILFARDLMKKPGG
jgi:hypothetical protein